MTKLEEEIYVALKSAGMNKPNLQEVKAAAEVSKRYIEKAFEDAYDMPFTNGGEHKTKAGRKDQWIKDNL
jgi:hypothetical protein